MTKVPELGARMSHNTSSSLESPHMAPIAILSKENAKIYNSTTVTNSGRSYLLEMGALKGLSSTKSDESL